VTGDAAFAANAWSPGAPDRGEEWLEVHFSTPVHATAIEVYETLNPGTITRILVRDLDFQLREVWSGSDPHTTCPATLRIDFEPLPFPTNRVRVELNTSLVPGYNQIDAVKLIGTPVQNFVPILRPVWPFDDSGAAWDRSSVDFDNDGWPDLATHQLLAEGVVVGTEVPKAPAALMTAHNESERGLAVRQLYSPMPKRASINGGPFYGDYDNDGDPDLFCPLSSSVPPGTFGGQVEELYARNLLLRNDNGHIVDVTEEAGLTDEVPSTGGIWLDYNRDGKLDLYVTQWSPPVLEGVVVRGMESLNNILYRNNGDGTFADVTAEAGLDLRWHDAESPLRGWHSQRYYWRRLQRRRLDGSVPVDSFVTQPAPAQRQWTLPRRAPCLDRSCLRCHSRRRRQRR